MTIASRFINGTIKGLMQIVCRIDAEQLARVSDKGPLIVMSNHINFLEPPVYYTNLIPRPMAFFAKAESWDMKLMGKLFDMWGGIPIKRGTADIGAIRLGLKALEDGDILAVAPEGTRSEDGILQVGLPGVVIMALRSGAPLLPTACFGHEKFKENITRLRRTDFIIRVGQPFTLQAGDEPVTSEVRQKMTDEIMYQIAALLPPFYRGVYTDLAHATETYLRFSDPGQSSLQRTLERES
jgi:1-acyl-sn-glycerol-3-phosphate acyltransferase